MHGLAVRLLIGWLLGTGVAESPLDACAALAALPLPPSARLQGPAPAENGSCRVRVELAPPASWRDLYRFFRDLPGREASPDWTLGYVELQSRGGTRSRVTWQVRFAGDGRRYEVTGGHEPTATITVRAGSPYPSGRVPLPEVDQTLGDLLPEAGDLESELWEPHHYMRVVSFREGPVLAMARSIVERLRAGTWQIRKIVVKLRDRPPWVAADSTAEAMDMLRDMPEEAGILEARRDLQELGVSLVAAEGRVFVVLTLDRLWP